MPTDDSRFDKEVVNTIKGVKMVSDIILYFLPNKRHISMMKKMTNKSGQHILKVLSVNCLLYTVNIIVHRHHLNQIKCNRDSA